MAPPRKLGVQRYEGGRIKPPTVAEKPAIASADMRENMSVVLAQRARLVGEERAESRLCATTIGRLFLKKKIDGDEFSAAEKYAGIVNRFCRLKGFPQKTVRAISLDGSGRRSAGEPDEEAILEATERFYEAHKALSDAAKARGTAIRPCRQRMSIKGGQRIRNAIIDLVDRYVVDDEPEGIMSAEEFENLRFAFRTLHAHFERDQKPPPINAPPPENIEDRAA